MVESDLRSLYNEGMLDPNPPEHYYQNQGMVPGTGPVECVTTSVVITMNRIKDRLALALCQPAIPDILVREYAASLDGMGWRGLRYRFPSNFFLSIARGWMHPVWQAPHALRKFAGELDKKIWPNLPCEANLPEYPG